ncbi:MAG: BhlA/UviB family holin-like peptide [Firmicutes bacterium]|nr:BhlA/UviB family holin-like peptide [Bacillota bacterium]
MDAILTMALGNGLWCALFCFLFFHLIRDAKKREKKYQETINMLGGKIDVVVKIKEDTERIMRALESEDRTVSLTRRVARAKAAVTGVVT